MTVIAPPKQPRVRLRYLDGIRGIASLLVLLHHVYLRIIESAGPTNRLKNLNQLLLPGHCIVALFLVLSGYVLMIPIVKTPSCTLPAGFNAFMRQRVRRIFPTYYAALVISLAPLVPGMLGYRGLSSGPVHEVNLTTGSVLAHFLMIHNFRREWSQQINSPMWTIATEWQLYFVFPAILLPLWRRFGSVTTIICGVAMGVLLGPATHWRNDCCPWYAGLFAMGMAGAYLGFGLPRVISPADRRIGWILSIIATAITAWILYVGVGSWLAMVDTTVGLLSMALLIACTHRIHSQPNAPRGLFLRFLESPIPVWLGAASYALYLVHQPLATLTDSVVTRLVGPDAMVRPFLIAVIAIPISIVTSRVLNHFFGVKRKVPERVEV